MTYKEVLESARGQMGPCHACPVCNGRACGATIPGPGAKGSGTVAALVFATLVGLVAGILPANKAVKISALEAIRHD